MNRWPMKTFASLLLCLGVSAAASAQQRPLVTEDPETVGAGNILIESGFEWQNDIGYPASGLRGDRLRVPIIGVSFGFSSILELQIDGGFYDRLKIESRAPALLSPALDFDGETTADVEDFTVATKIRLVSEAAGRPSVGIRLATRLPTASTESGLGLDTMDFYMTGLIGKTVQSVRIVGNFGLGILSDPEFGSDPNHVLVYGASFARALHQGLEFVADINGRFNTRESENDNGLDSRAGVRTGMRFTRGSVRVDGGLLFGFTANDPDFGFTGGVTYVFRGFKLP